MWTLDLIDDLDADFRVHYGIHGIGDGEFGGLGCARFFALALRAPSYSGATLMGLRRLAAQLEQRGEAETTSAAQLMARERVASSAAGADGLVLGEIVRAD